MSDACILQSFFPTNSEESEFESEDVSFITDLHIASGLKQF